MQEITVDDVKFRSNNGLEIECLSEKEWINIDVLILKNDEKRFLVENKIFSYKIIENAMNKKFKLVVGGGESNELLSIVMSSKSKETGVSFSRGRWNIFINSKYVTSAREKDEAVEYRRKLVEYMIDKGINVETLKKELKNLRN